MTSHLIPTHYTHALSTVTICLLQAAASRLPAAIDRAWEAVGGGPADLVFPELFLGRWTATSTLVSLETPLGADQLPPALVGSQPCQWTQRHA